jgi:hypothetical protein
VTQYEYEYYDEAADDVFKDFGEVNEGYNLDASPENNLSLPFDEDILGQYADIARWQGHYYDRQLTDEEIGALPDQFFQDPDTKVPNVTFISTDCKLSGGYTIGGLVFVIGDGEFGGGISVEGIVYCTGRFWGHGGGGLPVNINGAVYAGAVDIRGTTDITYEWEYFFGGFVDPNQPEPKYIFRSWQELVGDRVADSGGSLDSTLTQ